MQYLKVNKSTTLQELASKVGNRNVDQVLANNDLVRTPNIGSQFFNKCEATQAESAEVTWQKKVSVLNTFTSDSELFEEAATLSENGWKVLANRNTFPGYLVLPETLTMPTSTDLIGGVAGRPIDKKIYKGVIQSLQSGNHSIDHSIFNKYGSTDNMSLMDGKQKKSKKDNMYNMFNIPWGKIQLYSSLADETIDFPCYPEELQEGRKANYTTMPDTLYQYEPWYIYESSGPREQEYTFHFHRDMWSGDHNDGKAIELVRFCEACCYPRYNGSAVQSSKVRLYINGKLHIAGILTECNPSWSGPIGHDGWYLECELSLRIIEVSDTTLDFDTIKSMGVIGN